MTAMSRDEFEALADEWQQTGGWAPPPSLVEDLIDTVREREDADHAVIRRLLDGWHRRILANDDMAWEKGGERLRREPITDAEADALVAASTT